jgi:hypothetical protein
MAFCSGTSCCFAATFPAASWNHRGMIASFPASANRTFRYRPGSSLSARRDRRQRVPHRAGSVLRQHTPPARTPFSPGHNRKLAACAMIVPSLVIARGFISPVAIQKALRPAQALPMAEPLHGLPRRCAPRNDGAGELRLAMAVPALVIARPRLHSSLRGSLVLKSMRSWLNPFSNFKFQFIRCQ